MLTVLSGLCGAGKSTRACILVEKDDNAIVISFDDTRLEYPRMDDACIQKRLIRRAAEIILAGYNVIVDACNLHEHDRIRWETLAITLAVPFRWEQIDTDIQTCIDRDARRATPVGEARIRAQAVGSS